jgi:hypothetical protein
MFPKKLLSIKKDTILESHGILLLNEKRVQDTISKKKRVTTYIRFTTVAPGGKD